MSRLKYYLLAIVLACGTTAVWALNRYELVLTIKRAVPVNLSGSLPVRVLIDQSVDATLPDGMRATVRIGRLNVPLDETLEVPIDTVIAVPIDSDVSIDQPLSLALSVPIETVLTERELDLSGLEIPLDTELFVDDVLALNFVLPLDTQVKTTLGITVPVQGKLPIKARVPIHQKVHIHDRLALNLQHVRIPLKATIPIQTTLPFKQTLRIHGRIDVPLRQRLAIPIHQVVHPNMSEPIAVDVSLPGKVRAAIKAELATQVQVTPALSTQLGEIHLDANSVTLTRRAP